MPQSFTSLHLHIVFSTKDRAPLISPDVQSRLYEYVGGILRAEGCTLIAAGGMSDHVHLLVSLSKQMSVADAVRLVKSNSSKWIHETFADKRDFPCQAGYGAFAAFDPFCPIRNVTGAYPPTLLIHGDRDTDVPYAQSVMMAETLARANVPHELITVPGGGHGLGIRAYFREAAERDPDDPVGRIFARVLTFLDTHLQ